MKSARHIAIPLLNIWWPLLLIIAILTALACAAALVRFLRYKGVLSCKATGSYGARVRVKNERIYARPCKTKSAYS